MRTNKKRATKPKFTANGDWVHIDGFSGNVIRFIHEHE